MTDYTKLVQALRCKRDDCEGCGLAFFDKDEGWMCRYAAKDDDAADAIEKLVTLYEKAEMDATNLTGKLAQAEAQLPKLGEWIHVEGDEPWEWRCTVCHEIAEGRGEFRFCPNCGADMRKMEVQDG